MTVGEMGLGLVALIATFLTLFIAAKAYTPAYAFHAYVFAAASLATVFAIGNRYMNRDAGPVPQFIDGKPNYNYGPVKFSTLISLFWGVAGFLVGLIIALQLAFPAMNFDLPWISFGRLRPLHTSAVIFAFGGNVLLATTCSSSSPARATCSASRRARNTPNPSGIRTCG